MQCKGDKAFNTKPVKMEPWPRGLLQSTDANTASGKELQSIRKRFDNAKRYVRNKTGTVAQVNAIVAEAKDWMARHGIALADGKQVVQVVQQTRRAVASAAAQNATAQTLARQLCDVLAEQQQSLTDAGAGMSAVCQELGEAAEHGAPGASSSAQPTETEKKHPADPGATGL